MCAVKMHRVHTSASVGERKFAEKLTILVERGQGILTRVYNIKKVRLQSSRIAIKYVARHTLWVWSCWGPSYIVSCLQQIFQH